MNENNQHDQSNVVPPFAEPASQHNTIDSATDGLYGAVMNIPCRLPEGAKNRAVQLAYKMGHRDARHAAVDLIAEFAGRGRAQGGNTSNIARYRTDYGDPGVMHPDAGGEWVRFADVAARQSQAAQPSDELLQFTAKASTTADLMLEVAEVLSGQNWRGDLVEQLRGAAALAGQSQATKVQAVPDELMREAAFMLQNSMFQFCDTGDKAFDLARRIYAALAAPAAQEVTQQAAPLAAAVRAAERVDAMHKGVVGVFAAIKAEHLAQASGTQQAAKAETAEQAEGEQANVLPPESSK